jgi:hypothetical protein
MSNTDPLPTLWLRLRAMFVRASESIGAPQTLARLGALSRQRRHEIGCWIARLECIARKLLFAEASNLHHTSSFRTRASAIRNPGANATSATHLHSTPRQRTEIDFTQPHTWPGRFKLAPPRDARAVPERRAPRIRALWGSHTPPPPPPTSAAARTTPQTTPMAVQFAFRVEALRRVLENPAPHARRLARVLHRLKPRFPEAPARYAIIAPRPYAPDAGDPRLMIECLALAITAAEIFLNSS